MFKDGMKRTLLYLSFIVGSHSHERKLAGVRRYCSMRGWEVVAIPREEVSPETLPHPLSWDWSRLRVRWFREAAIASGAKCFTFPGKPTSARETGEAFSARLVPWLSKLPEHCAVFAACDAAAALVTQAAALARRVIPRSLTLVSVDNFEEVCENAVPPISSLQLDFEREGFIAAKALAEGHYRKESEIRDRLGPLMVVHRFDNQPESLS